MELPGRQSPNQFTNILHFSTLDIHIDMPLSASWAETLMRMLSHHRSHVALGGVFGQYASTCWRAVSKPVPSPDDTKTESTSRNASSVASSRWSWPHMYPLAALVTIQ